MSEEEFKVKLGVEVDTSKIQEQLKSAVGKTPIEINAKLSEQSLSNIKSQLNNIGTGKGKEVKITADAKDVKKQVDSALSAVNKMRDTKPINIAANTDSVKREVSGLSTVIERSKISISELKNQLLALNFDNGTVDSLIHDLKKANAEITNIDANFKDDHTFVVTTKGVDEFNRKIQTAITMKKEFDEEGNFVGWNKSVNNKIELYKKSGDAAKEAAAKEKQAAREVAEAQKQAAANAKQAAREKADAAKKEADAVTLAYEKQKAVLNMQKYAKENSAIKGTSFETELNKLQAGVKNADKLKLTNINREFDLFKKM